MNMIRRLSFAVVALGITVSFVGSSAPIGAVSFDRAVVASQSYPTEPQPQIIVPDDATVTFSRSEVITVAAPPRTVELKLPDPMPVMETPVVRKESSQPVAPVASPVPVAPIRVPVTVVPPSSVTPTAPVTPTPAPKVVTPVAPTPVVSRVVNVGLTGGQKTVDLGHGPVLFPIPAIYPPYVVEHDYTGGWARFGSLRRGMKVQMTGLVGGTYTVGQIINVPQGGGFEEFRQFSTMPKVMLQTCIPGTKRMIIVGLY